MTAEQKIKELELKVAELKAENDSLKKTICQAYDSAEFLSDTHDILEPIVFAYRGLT